MPDERSDRAPSDDPPYKVFRSEGSGRADAGERPYTTYRSTPKGLRSRLRGEDDLDSGGGGGDGGGGGGRSGGPGGTGRRGRGRRGPGVGPFWRRRPTVGKVILAIVAFVVGWLLLSAVLFMVSATNQSGNLPPSLASALTSGSNMITGTDTVLVIGTDQRPKGSKEPGAFAGGIRSDTIMLWRIGGGTSRRLSIPRDTLVPIPGHGTEKINAAYSYGGPALTIRTIKALTGLSVNHIIIVNLANFPKFIDDIGGVDVKTGRICSEISGGVKNGGFSLYLRPGEHHLDGRDALTLARTRENKCNAASNDLTREGYQQKILNAIKSRLISPSIFFHLPWASWDAPKAVRTDMGGFTLLQLFAAAELGGSAPTRILGQNNLPLTDVASPSGQAAIHRAVSKLMGG